MKKMMLFYVAVSAITAQLCFAQSEAGHGGNAVFKDNHFYLLDLVEAKKETTGLVDLTTHDCPMTVGGSLDADIEGECLWYRDYADVLSREARLFGFDVAQAVVNAATHLPDYDALTVLKAIRLFDWNIIPLPLARMNDYHSPVDLKDYPVYQLAVRKDRTITINKTIWDQMDVLNKTALITHEVLYALLRPIPDSFHPGFMFQDSYYAREMNANLYMGEKSSSGKLSFASPRLRLETTNDEYTFASYSTAFGNYGEADDFIGHDVVDLMALTNKSYIGTGAYIKLEGVVQTNLVPGAKPESVARMKWTFFNRAAGDTCRTVFANTGHYTVKVSLVRTLFTMQLASYPLFNGHSKYIKVEPSEMRFSQWYRGDLGKIEDQVELVDVDEQTCIDRLKHASKTFETIMRNTHDFRNSWLDAN